MQLTHSVNSNWKANNLPNNGTASDVAGIVSATIFKNTVNDSKIVTPVKCREESNEYLSEKVYNPQIQAHTTKKLSTVPNDNFSPESGGNVNPNNAIEAISTHGTIKLKK